jgi:protein TonB
MNRNTLAIGLALAVLAPAAALAQVAPVRVGGEIKEPKKLTHVAPVYPEIAQVAGVQGVVIIEALIGEDGAVREARVLRPVPLLDQAAIDAVLQWKYTPTLLNGQPVPVIMTVTVTFTLQKTGEGTAPAQPQQTPTEPVKVMTAAGVEMVPVRVGGEIKEPTKIKHVSPFYPPEAQAARLEGAVILEAIIDTDGTVTNLKTLRSVSGLDDAAISAVRQWKYTPTLLNGVAVPVIMTVTVTFSLR